jgi:branched-chain amino acid aminotransferase
MPDYSQLRAYHNGQLVPLAEARVSIFDHALVMGDMIFEMTRSFAQKPFLLDRHLDRLWASLRLAEIDPGLDREGLLKATEDTIAANLPHIDEGLEYWIRHDISRGGTSLFRLAHPQVGQPTVLITILPIIEHLLEIRDAYDKGIHLVIPSQRAIPSRYLDPKAKTRTRLHYELANLQAHRVDPKAKPVLLDEHGFIAENTSANFFMVKDGALWTPEPRNVLRGVSRGWVFELAAELGIPVTEGNIEPYDVMLADEAFLTSTSVSILPVTRFEGYAVGQGTPGPVTLRLLKVWGEKVGVDIIAQARSVAEKYG